MIIEYILIFNFYSNKRNIYIYIYICVYIYVFQVDSCSDEESFEGACDDTEEYGNQNDLFDALASAVDGTSNRPGSFEKLNQSDSLPEDFLTNSFLEVSWDQNYFVITVILYE